PQSLNLYSYTKNNPVIYVDHDGHNPLLIAAAVQIIRFVAKKIGRKVAIKSYRVLKPYLKRVRDDAKNYTLEVSGPNIKNWKFRIAIKKKGISKPIFRIEYHYELGKWQLHYHVGNKRIVLWEKK
ncbi:MAG: hypothetical protein H0Z31_15685, partial [Bacillus sp. (in: Bacteria)]|nr:hypothetical protein [Bacillus sp. (in: firmicutes)]